ncbi:hypothetical protein HID58_043391 [Brassica napus]|uniref:F-box domain-containing protein n=1 Tax=Brassica napus TaxID=3708 RepID=A0ABQ8BGR5_BRANA|nr:hypothetical protein HID58_043391 [Brassica napus]
MISEPNKMTNEPEKMIPEPETMIPEPETMIREPETMIREPETTVPSSLPGDLVEDILSRVLAIPLVRLRETSKQWNAKLKSGSFAKMHAAHAPKEESLMITLINHKVCLVKINLHAPSVKVAPHALYL